MLKKEDWMNETIKHLQVIKMIEHIHFQFHLIAKKKNNYFFQQDFEAKLLKAMKEDGWDGYPPGNGTKPQWTFSGSLFYSIIVITTIGKC